MLTSPPNGLTTSSELLVEPMTLSTLLDRSLRLAFIVGRQLVLILIALAALDTLTSYLQESFPAATQRDDYLPLVVFIIGTIVRAVAGIVLFLMIPLLAASAWRSTSLLPTSDALSKVGWSLFFRWIHLSIHVFVCAVFFLLLFVIPGIVYMINRVLAFYILVIEDTSVREALTKSKQVMSHGSMFSSKSPWFRVGIIAIVTWILSLVIAVVLIAPSFSAAFTDATTTASVMAVTFLAQLCNQLVQVFAVVAYTGLYFDATARFQGADLLAQLE